LVFSYGNDIGRQGPIHKERKKELKVGLSLLKSKKDIEITDQYCGGTAILR
jgi:hypothetical protein